MTTNVRDSLAKKFVADSRWSVDLRPHQNAILYIDDAAYGKILKTTSLAYMFAGSSQVIDQWKSNIAKAEQNRQHSDWRGLDVNGMAVSIVSLSDSLVVYEYGHQIRLPDPTASEASFAGTGSYHASSCWKNNRDPVRAVETAKKIDIFTGGSINYLDFLTGQHNLAPDISLKDLRHRLTTKGMVMNLDTNTISQAAALQSAKEQAQMEAILAKIRSGQIPPIAPCDAVHNKWSAEEHDKLIAVMEKQYGHP